MEELLTIADDFVACVSELVRWIKEEGKEFPYSEKFIDCACGINSLLRAISDSPGDDTINTPQIFAYADEFSKYMKFMVKTNVLTKTQSKPLLEECAFIKDETARIIQGSIAARYHAKTQHDEENP